jgi:hypothetical protein
MTSDIAAPAAGGVDGAAGLPLVGAGLAGEELCVGPDCPLTWCEHPVTSSKTVTSAAIRISSG